MNRSDFVKSVSSCVSMHMLADESEITEQSAFATDIGADELDIVEIAMDLEDTYGIEFTENEVCKVETVGDFVDLIMAKRRGIEAHGACGTPQAGGAKTYRLCYVDGNIMYFTDSFETQRGDDWDDVPYQDNAGPPHEKIGDSGGYGHGHLVFGAWFDKDSSVRLPKDLPGAHSVTEINKGATPWLALPRGEGLPGGASIDETRSWCARNGICFAMFDTTRKA